jgi:hypothetical protein
MNSVATGLVLIPGAVALLVFFVFTYLYEQNRHSYFRAWQLAWAAYTLHYALKAVEYFRPFPVIVFAELAAAGGDGDLHLCLDPADEGTVPAEMV